MGCGAGGTVQAGEECTITALPCAAGAASVMAHAVANPLYMGYRALYKTVLESSKRGIAKAMRVFADKDNYPVLLHCIHGERVAVKHHHDRRPC